MDFFVQPARVFLRPLLVLLLLAGAVLAGAVVPAHAVGAGQDRDADGIPDVWERQGVMLKGAAGPRWLDLPAMGADPWTPDVFLHVDRMAGAERDQRPSADALKLVVDAFAASPFVSPTGSVGIRLHIDAGPDSLLEGAHVTWGPLSRASAVPWQRNLGRMVSGSYDWSALQAIKDRRGGFTESGRTAVFHYALFAHYHDLDDPRGAGASGNSRGIGGTDLIVTLGNFTNGVGSPQEQAGTLMHELGHNLGLRHGGCDDANLKPGYLSVMNYAYQMEGLTRAGMRGVVDFSRGASPALDPALAPPAGLLRNAAGEAWGRAHACSARGEVRAGASTAVLSPTPIARHGEADASCAAGEGVDDWRNIRLKVGLIGHATPVPARR